MGSRLRGISQDKTLIEHFYPLLVREWAGKTVVFPAGLVTLFREALVSYEGGSSDDEKRAVRSLLPLFVNILVQGQDLPSQMVEGIVHEVLQEYQPS